MEKDYLFEMERNHLISILYQRFVNYEKLFYITKTTSDKSNVQEYVVTLKDLEGGIGDEINTILLDVYSDMVTVIKDSLNFVAENLPSFSCDIIYVNKDSENGNYQTIMELSNSGYKKCFTVSIELTTIKMAASPRMSLTTFY